MTKKINLSPKPKVDLTDSLLKRIARLEEENKLLRKKVDLTDFADTALKRIEKLEEENNTLRKNLRYFLDMLDEAHAAYNQPNKRQEKRAQEVCSILGFSKDGKRTARVWPESLFFEYLELTHIVPDVDWIKNNLMLLSKGCKPIKKKLKVFPSKGCKPTEPISEKEAIKQLAEKHHMSADAFRQHINRYIIELRRRLKAENLPTTGLKTPPKVNR